MRKVSLFLLLLLWLLTACGQDDPVVPATTTVTAPPTAVRVTDAAPPPTVPATETAVSSPTAIDTAPTPTATPEIAATEPPTWPTPVPILPPFAVSAASEAEQAAAAALRQGPPPQRDDIGLAIAFRGVPQQPAATPAPVLEPLPVGTEQPFTISNIDDNTVSQITAVLATVSDHAYFWFDTGPATFTPDEATLTEAAATFDDIYETVTRYFGSEDNPGIDGDPRIHIVHASPLALCAVTESNSGNCRLAGYFSASNVVPRAVDPNSNEREMFIMNIDKFGTSFYLNVLGHEFRHMIEDYHDQGDADWVAEGSATLAEELLGYPSSGQQRGNLFLQNPDQQLNSWVDGNTLPYYGQGYLLNRYLFDRLGEAAYRDFAISPGYGLAAVDQIVAAHGLALTGEALWRDWLVALAIHNEPEAPDIYRFFGTPLNTAAMTDLAADGEMTETAVHQYAADYYRLPDGPVTINFQGQAVVPLLDAMPASGQTVWYAQRANYSNPRLTRRVDLRGVTEAELQYDVYVDIEEGYDFAYVSVSTDDGFTWQGLIAPNMQGTEPRHDPADAAYTDRFYTGRQQTWLRETIDLTPYAGQEILIRFEYVTDLILTYDGLALDNIAIPAVGFYDDAETAAAEWEAEGFVRATAYLPQTWPLQLITFAADGQPTIVPLTLEPDQTLQYTINAGEQRPILIVAASAPFTLQPAYYNLTVVP